MLSWRASVLAPTLDQEVPPLRSAKVPEHVEGAYDANQDATGVHHKHSMDLQVQNVR